MKTSKKKQTPETAARPTHPLAVCKPRGDRVVVRRDAVKDRTDGGVFLPQSSLNHKEQLGTIVSVGPGRTTPEGVLVPLDIRRGDRVIITSYAGLELRDPNHSRSEEDEYVILREDDILAVIPQEV
jgi:chaperonin GroES